MLFSAGSRGAPELQQTCSGTGPDSTAKRGASLVGGPAGGARRAFVFQSFLLSCKHYRLPLSSPIPLSDLLGGSTRSAPACGAVLQDPVYCDMPGLIFLL